MYVSRNLELTKHNFRKRTKRLWLVIHNCLIDTQYIIRLDPFSINGNMELIQLICGSCYINGHKVGDFRHYILIHIEGIIWFYQFSIWSQQTWYLTRCTAPSSCVEDAEMLIIGTCGVGKHIGPWLIRIKLLYQYRNSHCGTKTVIRCSI